MEISGKTMESVVLIVRLEGKGVTCFAESSGCSGGGCGVMRKCAKVCEEYNVGRECKREKE